MTTPILRVVRVWYCPQCGKEVETDEARTNRFHTCPKLRYLTAPLLPRGTAAKVELREREDYIGREMVRLDPERGRPVQSIVTTRDNGQDAIVFAPTATTISEV